VALPHRLVMVVPVARVAAVGSWWAANVHPENDWSAQPELNAAGDGSPATHRWASTALSDADLKAVLAKVCQIASVTPPTNAQWNGWTRQQKVAWLQSVRDALFAACGIWLDLCQQDGGAAWNDPAAALTRCGLAPAVSTVTGGV
jgi:hypothetical protein